MAHLTFNTDDPADLAALFELAPPPSEEHAFKPRRSVYGSSYAESFGLTPLESVPDVLIDPSQYQEVLDGLIAKQMTPLDYQYASWCPPGTVYDQNPLLYCWTWGGTGALMTTEAIEGKPTVLLAPASMGYLVGWQNTGNYLEDFIRGAREDGICEALNGNMNDHRNRASVWAPQQASRALHRLDKVYDTDNSSPARMMQHAISILACCRPLYIAYNWWRHALHCPRIRYTPGTYLNLTVDLRNSHAEGDIISLTGSRMVFSEAYGFISTILAA